MLTCCVFGASVCTARCTAGKYRRYRFDSLRDLLRVIRNKHNHYRCVVPHLLPTQGARMFVWLFVVLVGWWG